MSFPVQAPGYTHMRAYSAGSAGNAAATDAVQPYLACLGHTKPWFKPRAHYHPKPHRQQKYLNIYNPITQELRQEDCCELLVSLGHIGELQTLCKSGLSSKSALRRPCYLCHCTHRKALTHPIPFLLFLQLGISRIGFH